MLWMRLPVALATFGIQHCSNSGLAIQLKDRTGTPAEVYKVTHILDELRQQAVLGKEALEKRTRAESALLRDANDKLSENETKVVQETLIQVNADREELRGAFSLIDNFVATLKQVLRQEPNVASCAELTCGKVHAHCNEVKLICECDEGYEGDGFTCRPPLRGIAPTLFSKDKISSPGLTPIQPPDGSGAVSFVASVYQNLQDEKAYLRIGQVGVTAVDWGVPIPVSRETGKKPRIIYNPGDSVILIAYIDASNTGMLTGGRILPEKGQAGGWFEASDKHEIFGRNQKSAPALISLGKHALIFFQQETLDEEDVVTDTVGKAGIVNMETFSVEALYDFFEDAVSEISALPISADKFVVAFKGPASEQQASLVLGKLNAEGQLFFFSNKILHLLPEASANSLEKHELALVSRNRISLSMFDTGLGETQVALVDIDGDKNSMAQNTSQLIPSTFDYGAKPVQFFAKQVSMPFAGAKLPKTMLYWNPSRVPEMDADAEDMEAMQGGGGHAEVCRVVHGGGINNCRQAMWGGNSFIRAVSGIPLGEGRVMFFYTDYLEQGFFDIISVEDFDLSSEGTPSAADSSS